MKAPHSTATIVLFLLNIGSTLALSAAPRFETFSTNIVGEYHVPGFGKESVELVGDDAIRDNGIEMSCKDNGGFVYFDCGSYSNGPIQLGEDDFFSASLSVPGSRVYVEGDVDEEGNMDGDLAMEYPRVVPDNEKEEMYNDAFGIDMVSMVPPFTVTHKVEASSSSDGKWGDLAWGESEGGEERLSKLAVGPYQLWLANKRRQDGGNDVCVGVACAATGFVKNFVRSYSSSGMLVQVARQEGKLKS